MIILDTSIWIDFLRQNNKDLNNKVTPLLEEFNVIALSFVFGELLQGAKNEKEEIKILGLWESLPKKIKEANMLIRAGLLSSKKKFITWSRINRLFDSSGCYGV